MQTQTDRFDYSQDYLAHGYKELSIPPGPGGAFQLDKNALHIWPRSSFMLIALPNLDGSFTCTLFLELDTFAQADKAWFAAQFPDALALMPDFDAQWETNPVSSLVTVRCYPWSYAGRALLVGDAAHAIVPFYGQGMNAGFEDCRVLMDTLEQCALPSGADDWPAALSRFEREHKQNADAIAHLAVENFVEMRDKVADPVFLKKRALERRLAALLPGKVVPLYTMVTFSPRLPYAEALRRGRAQQRVLDVAAERPDVDDATLRTLALELLEN